MYICDSQIVHHNPCFNLFILHKNLFDNQGSEIDENEIFYVSTYCLLQKLYSYYQCILKRPILKLLLFFDYLTKPKKEKNRNKTYFNQRKN